MTPTEADELVRAALARIAPEIDAATVDRGGELQWEFDLDSIDFISLVEGLSDALGHDIPERDYPRIATLDHLVAYVAAAPGASAP